MKNKIIYIFFFFVAVYLRFSHFAQNPPSLYWEEAALGYDAYSILHTGKDHHGNSFPLVAFESFGDWKPAGYFYAVVPAIKLLGLTPEAVRLPSALAGLAIVIGVTLLAVRFSVSPRVAIAVASISPWAIQFSRSAWESNLATACIVWAVYFGYKAIEKTTIEIRPALASVVLFIFSMYTYHSARMTAPLLILGLIGVYLLEQSRGQKFSVWLATSIRKNFLTLSVLTFSALILLFPIFNALRNPTFTQRFAETSIFSDLSIIEKSNALKAAQGNSLFSRLIYHRYLLFSQEIALHFLSHFDLTFLFLSGDPNVRHSIQFYGELYHVEIVFLILGVIFFLRQKSTTKYFLFYWLFVAILPASLTTATPHSLRALAALPVFLLCITAGISVFLRWLSLLLQQLCGNTHKLAVLLVAMIYIIEFIPFWRYYTKIYPVLAASEWQYGYAQLIDKITTVTQNDHTEPVYITREQGRPAMYLWFFSKTDPKLVQTAEKTATKDQGEFLEYQNYHFIRLPSEITASTGILAASEKFLTPSQLSRYKIIDSVYSSEGTIIWNIYKIQ